MLRDNREYICHECEEGRDVLVEHVNTHEHGMVQECRLDHFIVKTTDGKEGCWDYHECEEITRTGAEFPRR